MNILITLSNYTLITVPEKYDADIRKPKETMEHRRALKHIKKYPMKDCVITVDMDTNKAYHDPNTYLSFREQARRQGIKINNMRLYVRDIVVKKVLTKPNKNAL